GEPAVRFDENTLAKADWRRRALLAKSVRCRLPPGFPSRGPWPVRRSRRRAVSQAASTRWSHRRALVAQPRSVSRTNAVSGGLRARAGLRADESGGTRGALYSGSCPDGAKPIAPTGGQVLPSDS